MRSKAFSDILEKKITSTGVVTEPDLATIFFIRDWGLLRCSGVSGFCQAAARDTPQADTVLHNGPNSRVVENLVLDAAFDYIFQA